MEFEEQPVQWLRPEGEEGGKQDALDRAMYKLYFVLSTIAIYFVSHDKRNNGQLPTDTNIGPTHQPGDHDVTPNQPLQSSIRI